VISESLVDDFHILISQLELFDMNTCDFTMKTDRELVLKRVQELYKGGISEFNGILQGDVKEMVVSNFTRQRSPMPYHLYLLANLPCILGGMTFFSTFRHASTPYQITYLVYVITYVGACMPVVFAIVMMLGQRFAGPKEQVSKLRPRHLMIGLLGSVMMIAWMDATWFVPCMIAAGNMPSVSTNPWHGPVMTVAISILTWPWVWFFYHRNGKLVEANGSTHAYRPVDSTLFSSESCCVQELNAMPPSVV